MKFAIIVLLTLGFCLSGCHTHDHPHNTETPADAHLLEYLKFKEMNPDTALIELKAHAQIAFKMHRRAEEWAELAARLDRAEKTSLRDMRRLNTLVIEIETDNNASAEKIEQLTKNMVVWDEMEKELKAQGIDPNNYYIPFSLQRKK